MLPRCCKCLITLKLKAEVAYLRLRLLINYTSIFYSTKRLLGFTRQLIIICTLYYKEQVVIYIKYIYMY